MGDEIRLTCLAKLLIEIIFSTFSVRCDPEVSILNFQTHFKLVIDHQFARKVNMLSMTSKTQYFYPKVCTTSWSSLLHREQEISWDSKNTLSAILIPYSKLELPRTCPFLWIVDTRQLKWPSMAKCCFLMNERLNLVSIRQFL